MGLIHNIQHVVNSVWWSINNNNCVINTTMIFTITGRSGVSKASYILNTHFRIEILQDSRPIGRESSNISMERTQNARRSKYKKRTNGYFAKINFKI